MSVRVARARWQVTACRLASEHALSVLEAAIDEGLYEPRTERELHDTYARLLDACVVNLDHPSNVASDGRAFEPDESDGPEPGDNELDDRPDPDALAVYRLDAEVSFAGKGPRDFNPAAPEIDAAHHAAIEALRSALTAHGYEVLRVGHGARRYPPGSVE